MTTAGPRTFLEYVCARLLGPPAWAGAAGQAYWRCPFHDDTNPSFHTMPPMPGVRERWACPACDRRGDVFDLLRALRDDVGLPEAAGNFGVHQTRLAAWRMDYEAGTAPLPKRGNTPSHPLRAGGGAGGACSVFPLLGRVPVPGPGPPEWWPGVVDHGTFLLTTAAGKPVRDWLSARGLRWVTIRQARLGLGPGGELLIPWYRGGQLTGVNVRRFDRAPRYCLWKGSRRCVYPGAALLEERPVLLCEGELDTLLAGQELGEWVQPVTLGTAAGRLRWGPFANRLRRLGVYVALDGDEAGDRGYEGLRAVLPDAVRLRPPDGMDLTDLHRGMGLREWFQTARAT
jgi:hypothetical protein